MKSLLWVLITVTGAGEVHTATFTTKKLCLEGRSLARYGETVEQYQEREKADRGPRGAHVGPGFFPDRGEWVEEVHGFPVLRTAHDVKWAECFTDGGKR